VFYIYNQFKIAHSLAPTACFVQLPNSATVVDVCVQAKPVEDDPKWSFDSEEKRIDVALPGAPKVLEVSTALPDAPEDLEVSTAIPNENVVTTPHCQGTKENAADTTEMPSTDVKITNYKKSMCIIRDINCYTGYICNLGAPMIGYYSERDLARSNDPELPVMCLAEEPESPCTGTWQCYDAILKCEQPEVYADLMKKIEEKQAAKAAATDNVHV
jgi:hypothetical protein